MQLQEILYTQGFGTRRVCAGLIQQGHVQVYRTGTGAELCTDAGAEFDTTGLRWLLRAEGEGAPMSKEAQL